MPDGKRSPECSNTRPNQQASKGYIEVNRFFPSSKACSNCLHVKAAMPLTIRSWRCDKCGILHDRDINAAQNIRNEAPTYNSGGNRRYCQPRHCQPSQGTKILCYCSCRWKPRPLSRGNSLDKFAIICIALNVEEVFKIRHETHSRGD